MLTINQVIAEKIGINQKQVEAAVALLDEGATVPFIARYRKEATQNLDDTQLRNLEEQLQYLREMNTRRETILKSIQEQEKLTPELEKAILSADSKTRLEDLYLPYKPKRRTKAQIAREAGLDLLAQSLLEDPTQDPDTLAADYLNPEHKIEDVKAALDGARQILMENFTENAELTAQLRDYLWQNAEISSAVVEGKQAEAEKFQDYFDYQEAVSKIPSHRALALFRGRRETFLTIKIDLANEEQHALCLGLIERNFGIADKQRPADAWLKQSAMMAWKVKLMTRLELDLLGQIREAAELEAIHVFAENLRDLLLAAPAGPKVTIGLDPGIRTGVKVVVLDETGKVLEHTTIYPLQPKNQWDQSIATLAALCEKYSVNLISIGNGTGSRETDKLVIECLKKHSIKADKIIVSEAGASVYSASELAAKEFPDLDVSIRGAVSIARRLQDPLAELVKIDPKSIGVGQYQHDVNQSRLARSLHNIVEDCVNAVGVDLNTASVPLLTYVSGLNETLAKNIVDHRDQNGAFNNRKALKAVPRMGDKTFEQSAGFLRIRDGENPLDNSSVHPESYPLVARILENNNQAITDVIGNLSYLKNLKPENYIDDQFGLPTVVDILKELEKPGRDPRPEFKTASFKDGVETIKDLTVGMSLEGVVSNVTNFGAFVDIGVHQDGLVHISEMADKYVDDPRTVVKPGDIVTIKVKEVDVARKRIALSMRQGSVSKDTAQKAQPTQRPRNQKMKKAAPQSESAFGAALKSALHSK